VLLLSSNHHKFFRMDVDFLHQSLLVFAVVYSIWTLCVLIVPDEGGKHKTRRSPSGGQGGPCLPSTSSNPGEKDYKKEGGEAKPTGTQSLKRTRKISFSIAPTVHVIDCNRPSDERIRDLLKPSVVGEKKSLSEGTQAFVENLREKLESFGLDPGEGDFPGDIETRVSLMNLLRLRSTVYIQLRYTFEGKLNEITMPSEMADDELDYNLNHRGINFDPVVTRRILKEVSFDYCLKNELVNLKTIATFKKNPNFLSFITVDINTIIHDEINSVMDTILRKECANHGIESNLDMTRRELFNALLASETVVDGLTLLRRKKFL